MSIIADGLPQLLNILPVQVKDRLITNKSLNELIEVVLDYGRPAEARFVNSVERWPIIISEHDIEYVVRALGEFGGDNRAGIERTLHRISAIRNRHGKIIGLTCRVGRALEGTIEIIDDVVRSGYSILLLGKPGVGKTTKLREVARVLADEVGKRVVIVDTSNEIGGDGDVPHPAIGSARRMQVKSPLDQHATMIEAVENHMPEVIVIDEIGNEAEANAARTIAERGVQLIGTAHGQTLENLMLNPALADLVGGIQAVTLSDDEARRRGTQKTVLERKAPPTFDVVIELLDYDRLAIHHNVQRTVDMLLRGVIPKPELRVKTSKGVEVLQADERDIAKQESELTDRFPSLAKRSQESPDENGKRNPSREKKPKREQKPSKKQAIKVYPFGIARTRLERAIKESGAPVFLTNDLQAADVVIAIRSTYQNQPRKLKELSRNIPVKVIKSNTFSQIAQALDQVLTDFSGTSDREEEALQETLQAIDDVMQQGKPVELTPRDSRVRKMQHQMIESKRLASEAVGSDPNRRIRVLPKKLG